MYIVPPSLKNRIQRNYKSSKRVAIIRCIKVYKGVKTFKYQCGQVSYLLYRDSAIQTHQVTFCAEADLFTKVKVSCLLTIGQGCRHWWPTSGIPAKEKELSWHERDKNCFARNWREKNFFVLPRVCLVRPLNTEMQPLSALYFSQTSEMAALYMPNVLVT